MQSRLARRQKQNEIEQLPRWERLGQRRHWQNLSEPYVTMARGINERRASRMGLEWRQPFWDARIIQAAFATPEHLLLRGHENKWLHRRALVGLLPGQVLQRQTKAEFSVAYSRYWHDLRPQLEADMLPRRQDWVELAAFSHLLGRAFGPERGDCWIEGIAWTLFGLDAVASCGKAGHVRATPTEKHL